MQADAAAQAQAHSGARGLRPGAGGGSLWGTGEGGGPMAAAFGEAMVWQGLASVALPGIAINRIVAATVAPAP